MNRTWPHWSDQRAQSDHRWILRRPELQERLKEPFQPWVDMVEDIITRLLGDSPLATLVPAHDVASAMAALFLVLRRSASSIPTMQPERRCSRCSKPLVAFLKPCSTQESCQPLWSTKSAAAAEAAAALNQTGGTPCTRSSTWSCQLRE